MPEKNYVLLGIFFPWTIKGQQNANFYFYPECKSVPPRNFTKNGNILCRKGHFETTIGPWGKTFKISFDFELKEFKISCSWRNLFEISAEDENGFGSRFPSVFISCKDLIISSYVGTDNKFEDYKTTLEYKKNYHIEIAQKYHVHFGILLNCIIINHKVEKCFLIKESKSFSKAYLFLSSPSFYGLYSRQGSFKNLAIQSL